jgi:hypothetical protein
VQHVDSQILEQIPIRVTYSVKKFSHRLSVLPLFPRLATPQSSHFDETPSLERRLKRKHINRTFAALYRCNATLHKAAAH